MQEISIEQQEAVAGGIPPAVAIVAVAVWKSGSIASTAGWIGGAIGAGFGAALIAKLASV